MTALRLDAARLHMGSRRRLRGHQASQRIGRWHCRWLLSTLALSACFGSAVAAFAAASRGLAVARTSPKGQPAAALRARSEGHCSGEAPSGGFIEDKLKRERRWTLLTALTVLSGLYQAEPSRAEEEERPQALPRGRSVDTVINSYTEMAGVSGQTNKDVAKYAQLGDGLRAATISKPKSDDGDPSAAKTVQNGDLVTVDLIGYLTGWNGVVFVRTQDKSGYSEKPLTFKVGAGDAIPGLDRGVVGMLKGEKRRLIIPPKLGYPRPCTEEQLGKPGAIPDPRESASGSGEPWEMRNRLLNGVLNNARDDTLVIDVKVVRISK
eukprot:TRINITY_DN50698_c0_g1_i1.p1 TRINITY_DN50698_c0_g1~~TRINITY_DN50698_c0_g1_i1.p1  ORF type:complete len:333 (-),score=50.59 TRINITY_DN50698_c0_g1_i1:41-1006(-)